MVLKSIILMRHAEREDRALEAEGKDWISTAPRPQDPKLSPKGKFSFKILAILYSLFALRRNPTSAGSRSSASRPWNQKNFMLTNDSMRDDGRLHR